MNQFVEIGVAGSENRYDHAHPEDVGQNQRHRQQNDQSREGGHNPDHDEDQNDNDEVVQVVDDIRRQQLEQQIGVGDGAVQQNRSVIKEDPAALDDALDKQEPKRHADGQVAEIDVGPTGQNHAIVERADGEDEHAGADHDPERAEHGRTVVEQDFEPSRVEPEAIGFGASAKIPKQQSQVESRLRAGNLERRPGQRLRRERYLIHLRQRLEPSLLPSGRPLGSTLGAGFRRLLLSFR